MLQRIDNELKQLQKFKLKIESEGGKSPVAEEYMRMRA